MGGRAVGVNLAVHVRKRSSPQFLLDVAFEVAPGVTIIFGESGSGKTTVLRSVAGLTQPDEGLIRLGDRALFDSRAGVNVEPSRRRVGFVFQHLALFPHLTAADNIAYGMARLPPAERRERTAAIAKSFRIGHLLERRPGEISGGERQRVGLARSLVTDPEILLLDEPLSALDHGTQSRIIADLRQWNDARRIPILYVTHSQREVFALGARALVLQEGAIIADGTPQQVMETPSHEHVAELAGFENMLDTIVVSRRPDAGVMVCRLTGTSVDLEAPIADVEEGRAVRVAIRAGDILIGIERPHGLSARNVVPGTIASLSRQGAVMRVEVTLGVPLEVHVTPAASDELGLRAGLAVWLVIKTRSCRPMASEFRA
jgi:molybdate transport system ATP-binding protein